MWQTIKTAAGTIWVSIKKVPGVFKAAPGVLDKGVRIGLGGLSQIVTQGLKVQDVSRSWNTRLEHFLYGGMPSESSGKEPFSHATHPMENRNKTAPLVDMTYKMGVTMLLSAFSVSLVLLMGPPTIIPLGILLGLATLLRFTGYMDPKLYKLLATGLMAGLMIAAMMGLTLLFPPLLALPLVGGALTMMTGTSGLLVTLGLMVGMSLLSTGISGFLDDGLAGVGRALFNWVKFPFNVAVYGLSSMASFSWDVFWWPFHGFYNDVYDPLRNKIREGWPKLTDALSRGWQGFTEGVGDLGLRLKGRWSRAPVEVSGEIDDDEIDLSRDDNSLFEESRDNRSGIESAELGEATDLKKVEDGQVATMFFHYRDNSKRETADEESVNKEVYTHFRKT